MAHTVAETGSVVPQQDTESQYHTGSDYSTPAPTINAFNAPTTTPTPTHVPAQPKQPPPDQQTQLEKQQAAINSYIYARAQRYIVGSAFGATFEKAPSYSDPDATTHGNAGWWVQHPQTFGNTITANVTEAQHRKLVKHMPQVYDWMAKNDRVAGVDGALTGMRLAALHIVDPTIRTWAINYIDSIKHLSDPDQQAVLAYMMQLTGNQNPKALLREALHARRAYVNAYMAQPQVQAQTRGAAKSYKNMAEGQKNAGAGLVGQEAVDYASQKYQEAVNANGGFGGPTGTVNPLTPEAQFWLNQLNQAGQEMHQEQVANGVNFSEDNGIIGSIAGEAKAGLKGLNEIGNLASGGLLKSEEQALAPHIQNWWRDGNNLPFTVHFTPDWNAIRGVTQPDSLTQGVAGALGIQTPPSTTPTFEQPGQAIAQNRELTLHHLSAQSEVEAAAAVATIVFAPGLIEFFGNQALNLVKLQAFMKILHGVNVVTQQAGQTGQQTQVAGVPGDVLNPLIHLGGTALSGIAGGLHAATSAADNIMLDVQNQLASGTSAVAGNFGWNMSDMQANIAAQIEMAMLMESMGRVGSDIKTNLGMTADAAKGQIGVGDTLAETYRLNDSSLFHPYRAVMDPIIDYHVTNFMQYLHATDLPSVFERWNDSNFLGRRGLFDIVESFRDATSGPVDYRTVLGKIRERYPMLPQGYAELLARTPRNEMLGASMDYIDGWGVSEFKSTKGQLGSVKAKLTKLNVGQQLAESVVRYKGETHDPLTGYPVPLMPDGTFAYDHSMSPPQDVVLAGNDAIDAWWTSKGEELLNQGWVEGDGPGGNMVLYPPDAIFPGTPEYAALNPPRYIPHPLEGQLRPVYAGHAYGFTDFSKERFNENALHGPGLYTTEDYTVAAGEPHAANIESAQASGGDLMNMDANIGYAGKHTGPSYDYHEIDVPPEIAAQGSEAEKIYTQHEAIQQRRNQLSSYGENPDDYNIETILSPSPKGKGTVGTRWSVATKVTPKGLPEPAPNVHFGYMDIKNPLDLDKFYPPEEAAAIINQARESLMPGAKPVDPRVFPKSGLTGDDIRSQLADTLGPREAVQALQNAGFDGLTHIGGNIMGHGHEHRVWIAFEPEQFHQGATPGLLQQEQALIAEKATLEDKLTKLQSTENEVITNLPTHSMPDFLHRVMYRPVGPVEGTFRTVLNFGRYTKRFLNWSARTISGDATAGYFNENSQSLVAKLVDKLDRRPQLRYASPDMPRAERMIVEDNNAQILDRTLQRIGMSPEDAALLKGRFAAAKSQEEWFNVLTQDFLGSTGPGMHLLSKYIPDNTPKWLTDRILGMADRTESPKYYQRQVTGLHGQTELGNMLDGELVLGNRNPLPAAPSMFKNSYNLPINDIETAMSSVSRWRARVGDVSFRKGDLFNNAAAQVYDWGKAGLALTTSVGKPLMMVANIPAIVATKMLDETMGGAMDPRILRQFHTRADALDYFSRIDPRILGKVVANGSSWVGLDGTDVSTADIERTAQSLYMHGMDRATAETVAQRLVDMSTDPMLSRIALEGDSERVLAVLYGENMVGIDPNAEGIIHFYRGQVASSRGFNDHTKYWWKAKFGVDTSAMSHEEASGIARQWAGDGSVEHYYIDPNARVLYQGTPEFDALVGPNSEFHSQASQEYQPGSILPNSGVSQQDQLDALYQAAKAQGYQAIHMNDQDFMGTAVIDPSILRDPTIGAQPVMADEHLARFFNEQLRPQVERSLEAFNIPVTEETVRARTLQLISDWHKTIHDATWQHPDLMEFVKHGRLGGRGISPEQAAALDGELGHTYQSLVDEVSALREHISKLDGKDDPAALAAAQQHLHDKLAAIDHIENTVLGTGDQTDQLLGAGAVADQIRQDTKKALADRIEKMWNQNELTPPDKFTVRTNVARLQTSSTTDVARSNARRLQDFMYRNGQFGIIGKAEAATAKGSFFSQRADQIAKGYIRSGMRPDEAVALAEWKAMDETRDMNYDITTKSTAERSIRNLMWFAPVQGELMYRWMYAIPATMGAWLPGAALMTARLTNWYHLLKTSGLVHKDAYTGEDVIGVPGLERLINVLKPGGDIKLPDTTNIPLLSINPHLFGLVKNPLPTLSPGPSFLLDQAAAQTHSPVLLDLATMFGQGGTNQFVPSAINSMLGMFGINVGSHMLGTSYQRLQWDRAHDVGLQYAWTDFMKAGNKPPTLADYGLDSAAKNYIEPGPKTAAKVDEASLQYQTAWARWFSQLNSLADQYAQGAYALNAISSSVLPGYIQESSTDQRAYQQFFKDNILPQINAGADQGVISDTINQWLAAHPNSQAFAISYNYYTGKQWDTPFQVTDPQYAKQLFTQGVKAPMDPTDYGNFLSGKAMIEGYRAQLNSAITAAAPDGQWQTLLRNWYKRGTAVQQYAQELDMFNRVNPDALRVYNDVQAKAMQAGHVYPHQGLVYEYVAQAMNDLRIVAPALFGGDTNADFKTVMSGLGQAKAQLYHEFPGAANDPMTKGINWYFDNVISPYYNAVNPLYEKANQLKAQGADTAAITDVYHQIDVVRRQFDNPGRNAPSPEEFSYASLSPYDQKIATITWATQPVSWLSEFQFNKVYGNYTPGVAKLFDEQYKFNKEQFLPLYNTTSPSSKYADALVAWRDQQYQNMADYYKNHGVPNAPEIMKLEQGVPYQRLQAAGWAQNNKGMQAVFDLAKQANDAINAAGNSPAGFSQTAVQWKSWFYSNLNQFMTLPETKPDGTPNTQVIAFHRAMDQLSQSQKTIGNTGIRPTGLALYEEIFFGNFSLDKYPAPTSITDLFK